METFDIRDLTFVYPGQENAALRHVSLTVEAGSFTVLCGPSGGGKTTLLRLLKPVLAPHGERSGEILFEGRPLGELTSREQAARIGFVLQSPENQIVTDKVWHELAFGLESLGCDTMTIRRRVAEMAAFFDIETWFHREVSELSGGQKQLLILASVMAMQPSVLILDEPTSQLDPIAAADFLATLGRVNRELGTTVLLTEHRLEEVFPLADRAAVLDVGELLCAGTPAGVGEALKDRGHEMFLAMPTPMRVWAAAENDMPCPVTVREGRAWLRDRAEQGGLGPLPPETVPAPAEETAAELEEVWFRYGRDLPDVVQGLSLTVKKGEFLALLGGNGAGKTTLLRLLCGLEKPWRGAVRAAGTVGLLPQDPQTLFVKKTVREDLLELLPRDDPDREQNAARVTALCRLTDLLDRHPFDLSGGEQQRLALAKVLLTEPDILLLDEPTKGMDAGFKRVLAGILGTLTRRGMAVVMVSHDVEFCASCAHRCALLFDGGIAAMGTPRAFFSGNSFYTTGANRMARDVLPGAVTAEDLISACGGILPPTPDLPEDGELPPPAEAAIRAPVQKKLPWWRVLGAVLFGAGALGLLIRFLTVTDLTALVGEGGMTRLAADQWPLYGALLLCLLLFALCVTRRTKRPKKQKTARQKLPKRTVTAVVLCLLLIPATLLLGETVLAGRRFYFIALLVLLECMVPFFLIFEGRRPQARELVILAVLCAIGVAGRAVFFMLPQFKPVMALVILAAAAFGGESGFLVGAVTMLVSNMLYGQGPWTPWQMFAMGLVGLIAGLLFGPGRLRPGKGALCVYGALAAIVLYGGIMNPAAALLWAQEWNWGIVLTYYVTGFPMDCIQAAATVFFLWIAAEPMLEKLERVKRKYGLLE